MDKNLGGTRIAEGILGWSDTRINRASEAGENGASGYGRTLRHSPWIDSQLLHASNERGAFDPHAGCDAMGPCYSPIGHFQNADDLIPFIGFACCSHRTRLAV